MHKGLNRAMGAWRERESNTIFSILFAAKETSKLLQISSGDFESTHQLFLRRQASTRRNASQDEKPASVVRQWQRGPHQQVSLRNKSCRLPEAVNALLNVFTGIQVLSPDFFKWAIPDLLFLVFSNTHFLNKLMGKTIHLECYTGIRTHNLSDIYNQGSHPSLELLN